MGQTRGSGLRPRGLIPVPLIVVLGEKLLLGSTGGRRSHRGTKKMSHLPKAFLPWQQGSLLIWQACQLIEHQVHKRSMYHSRLRHGTLRQWLKSKKSKELSTQTLILSTSQAFHIWQYRFASI